MFVILNLRNIIDNFIKYGIQFGTTPTDFIEVHTIGAGFGAMFFPMMLYFIEKIRFNKYMSQKICVTFI